VSFFDDILGGGASAEVKSPDTQTNTTTTAITGGPVQSLGPAVSGLGAQDNSTLISIVNSTDGGATAAALDANVAATTQAFAFGGSALNFAAGHVDRAYDALDTLAEQTARTSEQLANAYNDNLGTVGGIYEDALGVVKDAFGVALDATSDASARVADAFKSSAQLEGKVNTDGLLRMVLIGAAVVVALAIYTKK
jgi:hypothetical protein